MLCAYRQAHRAGIDVLLYLLLRRELRVGGGGRVYHQALHVGYIGQKREYFKRVDEPVGFLYAALDFDGEYRAAPVGEIASVKFVVGMVGQRRVVDLLDHGVGGQKLDYLFGV